MAAVNTVTAISDLEALDPAQTPVEVRGYYANGDGGGGLFYWSAGDTNRQPAPSGAVGWICTASRSGPSDPGTWKAFGTIAA